MTSYTANSTQKIPRASININMILMETKYGNVLDPENVLVCMRTFHYFNSPHKGIVGVNVTMT